MGLVHLSYAYTGATVIYTVPAGVVPGSLMAFTVVGGSGQGGGTVFGVTPGGKGGKVGGSVMIYPGDTIRIYVGGNGVPALPPQFLLGPPGLQAANSAPSYGYHKGGTGAKGGHLAPYSLNGVAGAFGHSVTSLYSKALNGGDGGNGGSSSALTYNNQLVAEAGAGGGGGGYGGTEQGCVGGSGGASAGLGGSRAQGGGPGHPGEQGGQAGGGAATSTVARSRYNQPKMGNGANGSAGNATAGQAGQRGGNGGVCGFDSAGGGGGGGGGGSTGGGGGGGGTGTNDHGMTPGGGGGGGNSVATALAVNPVFVDNWHVGAGQIDLWVPTVPVCAVTAPTGVETATSSPTITWSYTSAGNFAQTLYTVVVFAEPAGGWPAGLDGTGFASSSTVLPLIPIWARYGVGAVRSVVIGDGLPNGVYRAYVQVTDSGTGQETSAWASGTWTQNVTPPTAPTITTVAITTPPRVLINIHPATGGVTATNFHVQRSVDNVNWTDVVNGVTIPPNGNPTEFFDRGAPREQTVYFRVRAETGAVFSAWSAVATAYILNDGNEWLISASDSTLDAVIQRQGPTLAGLGHEQQADYFPEGRSTSVVVGGTIQGEQFISGIGSALMILAFEGDAPWQLYRALRARREPLLFRTIYGDTGGLEQFWLRLGPDAGTTRFGFGGNLGVGPTGRTPQIRTVQIAGTVVAEPTTVIDSNPPPAIEVPSIVYLPTISGNPIVGYPLTLDYGVWSGNPTGFSQQWYSDGVAIAGAIGTTYIPQMSDLGNTLAATVIATNLQGPSGGYSTLATGVVSTVPGAPTAVTAFVTVDTAFITFTPPTFTGGLAITSYEVEASTGQSVSGTASPMVILGLDPATTVTFAVTAANANGYGVPSMVSASANTPPTATQLGVVNIVTVAPVWNNPNPPNPVVGVEYSYTLPVTGATSYALTSGSLPPGLALNTQTGVIGGVPTTTTVLVGFIITAYNSNPTGSPMQFGLISVGVGTVTHSQAGTMRTQVVSRAFQQGVMHVGSTPAGASHTQTGKVRTKVAASHTQIGVVNIAAGAAVTPYTQVVNALPGVQLWLRLNEPAGATIAVDSSGGNNNGTYTSPSGTSYQVLNPHAGSVGADQYMATLAAGATVTVPNNPSWSTGLSASPTSTWSVLLWNVLPSSNFPPTVAFPWLLGVGDGGTSGGTATGWQMFATANTLAFKEANTQVNVGVPEPLNSAHSMIAVTYGAANGTANGANCSMYQDGAFVAGDVDIDGQAVTDTTNPLVIGPLETVGQLIITNTCLSAAQIAQIHNAYTSSTLAPGILSAPTITGTATVNQTLTVTSDGTYSNGVSAFSQQWYRIVNGNPVAVAGQTGTTYAVTTADLGLQLLVGVTATNVNGPSALNFSNPSGAVAAAPVGIVPVNTVIPTISASPTAVASVGTVITITNLGTWTQNPTSYAYQWVYTQSGTPIAGATANTYKPVTADITHNVGVKITASNAFGPTTGPATSLGSAAVTAAIVVGGTGNGIPPGPTGPSTPAGGFRVVFADDFNNAIDGAHWSTARDSCTGQVTPYNFPGEVAYFSSGQVSVANSCCVITAQAATPFSGLNYASGAMETGDTCLAHPFSFSPSVGGPFYMECKVKMPGSMPGTSVSPSGSIFPAIWAIANQSGQAGREMDFLEVGGRQGAVFGMPNLIDSAQLAAFSNPTQLLSGTTVDLSQAFHLVTAQINTDGSFSMWIDGNLQFNMEAVAATQYMGLLFNYSMFAVPGAGFTFDTMQVDYIAMYQAASVTAGTGYVNGYIAPGTVLH